jgi:hypothetical protein
MQAREFDRMVKECFGRVLEPHRFTCAQTRRSSFWRKVEGDLYHFIIADRFHHRPAYDVMVFASSPRIDPEFGARFPDDLGVPSDSNCRLNAKSGIGSHGSSFPCGTKEAFQASFNSAVARALEEVAVPYLDGISSIEALLATIRHPGFRLLGT